MFRVLKISAALALVGAVAGAVGGYLALLLALILGKIYTSTELPLSFITGAVTLLGCICGVLVAPVLSWTVLRNVPIWRCATETSLATSFALISADTMTNETVTWKLLAIAVLAAALAVARLKWEFRNRRASEPSA